MNEQSDINLKTDITSQNQVSSRGSHARDKKQISKLENINHDIIGKKQGKG